MVTELFKVVSTVLKSMRTVVTCCAASGIQSADETSIHRHATSDAVSTGNRSMHSRQGHHSVRATLELDIQRPMRPAANAAPVIVDIEPAVSSDLEERVSNWDFIGRSSLFVY